ncbi:hypothetical protein [Polaribacter sp. R77954]|uniref:hypothetical protein n=1 Tax=Polaribacter sp. R77954 TaxID=3093870 RepID=UPI0037C59474
MKKIIILILFTYVSLDNLQAQQKKDTIVKKINPILFMDLGFGYANGSLKGFTGILSVNYQNKNDVFTLRHIGLAEYDNVDFFLALPFNIEYRRLGEYAVLYGKRYIDEGTSYHFSGGFSYNSYQQIKSSNILASEAFVGFPLEAGISWFKNNKQRFRLLYSLLPIGKRTGFGRSFGVKLYANLSKRSFVGLGLSFGLGWHKTYE